MTGLIFRLEKQRMLLQVILDTNTNKYNEPAEQHTVVEATDTVGSGHADLDVTNPSVQQTNCVSWATPKAFVVSKFACIGYLYRLPV